MVTALWCLFCLWIIPGTPEVWSQTKAVVQGSSKAKVGGLRRGTFSVDPVTLHPLNATGVYAQNILGSIYEDLLELSYEKLEYTPLLAKRFEVSKDKLTYTFYLNPKAKWADGKPLTAEDVKFSMDLLLNKKLKTFAKWQSYYSRVKSVKVLDPHTVRFNLTEDHFLNMVSLAGIRVVPKHMFNLDEPNKTKLTKKPVGSGAYRMTRRKRGNSILLERRDDYWGWDLPQNKYRFNAKHELTKIILNDKVALETFKKKELDILSLTAKQWVHETKDPRFGIGRQPNKPFVKLQVRNKQPRSYGYVGWNLESPLFNDRRVRMALSHLFDRKTIIDKFYFNLRVPAVGPFEVNSVYSSPKVKPIKFSIPKAIALLKAAGWKDTDKDGIVDKNGRPLRFTVLTADNETSPKLLTLTQGNMRQAGVDLKIKVVEWSTLLKIIDEYTYDAVMLGWSRGIWTDPTALWHSKGAVAGGLNLVRYKNPEVDKLIDRAAKSVGTKERIRLYRKVHELIHRDQPYAFMVEQAASFYAYNADLQQAKKWYNYALGSDYWWLEKPAKTK